MHEFRPMSVPSILDETFRLYREHFLTFLTIALVIYVPYSILAAFVLPSPNAAPFDPANFDGVLPPGLLVIWVCSIIVNSVCTAAMTQNISAAYLGTRMSATASYRGVTRCLGWAILTHFLATAMTVAGMFCCVVPGVLFLAWFSVSIPVVVLEGHNSIAAMTRSRDLVKGNEVRALLLVGSIFILGVVYIGMLAFLLPLIPMPGWLLICVQNILSTVVVPVLCGPLALLYYDLRIRKEAFDLQMLASALQQPVTA
jgi:hypothetical protein